MRTRLIIGTLVISFLLVSVAAAPEWREMKRADVPADIQKAMARFGAGDDTRYFRLVLPPPKFSLRVDVRDAEGIKKYDVSGRETVVNGKTNLIVERITPYPVNQ